jgi:uncharacterized protein involved in tellurium resistance
MITFQIVLTTSQIATLRGIQEQNDFLNEHGLAPGDFTKLKTVAGSAAEQEYMSIGRDLSHYVTSARALMREGLVKWDKQNGHVVTEKGRLTLRLIEMDIEETSRQLKALTRPRPVKQIKRGSK